MPMEVNVLGLCRQLDRIATQAERLVAVVERIELQKDAAVALVARAVYAIAPFLRPALPADGVRVEPIAEQVKLP